MSKNYYDVLGVSKNATKAEMNKAYKKLAVQHHPDRGGDSEKMKEINEAWDTLKNETKRTQYDNGGQNGSQYQQRGGFSRGFSSPEEMEEFVRRHMHHATSGGGWYHSQPRRNEDIYVRVNVSLKDVYECGNQTIEYDFPGVGVEKISFDIPKGCYDGAKIKIPNKGSHQDKQFPRSNLIVMFQIESPINYDVSGHDILTLVKVNIIDIITGSTHIVDFIDGSKIEVKIPQGFEYRKQLRVNNKGLWRNGSIRGDLKIIVDYDIPKYDLTKKQLKILREIKNG